MVESYMPESYQKTLELLNVRDLTIIAGGTDLMVKKRNWAGLPPEFKKDLVFVSQLKELDYIIERNNYIHIGATATLERILYDENTPGLLKKAISLMASPGIRNTATLAGNIGNASPAGDTLPVLYILDAKVILGSLLKERTVSIDNFITGPGSTDLQKDEMIKEIVIQKTIFDLIMYEKVGGRKTDAISKVSFAAAVSLKIDVVGDIRIAFGAVAPTIVRLHGYETRLRESPLKDLRYMTEQIKAAYKPHITPINDQRSSAEYRTACSLNLLEKFILNSSNIKLHDGGKK